MTSEIRFWLKALREEKSLTQQEAADLIGITQGYFCEVENGVKTPTPRMAKAIAEKLNFDWTKFFEQISRPPDVREKGETNGIEDDISKEAHRDKDIGHRAGKDR
jgi:putative transcriptional regulator